MSKKKDIKNLVRMSMIGNNTTNVTGSVIHISFFDKDINRDVNILLEIGGINGGTVLENYNNNLKMLEKIDAKNIDFVIINHFHADHSSNLGSIIANGFRGKAIMTKESASIALPMLNDSCFVNQRDCEWLKRCRNVKAKPFFQPSDVEIAMSLIERIPTNEMIKLTPNIEMKFLESRHILGSCTLQLFMKDSNSRVHKLFYTSDLGNINNDYFIADTQYAPSTSNISIYESTYAKPTSKVINKKLRKQELLELEETIKRTIKRGGSCLLPTFSLHRSPSMLMYIKKIIDKNEELSNVPVVVDGRLCNELLDVYERICEGQNKLDIDEILQWKNLIRIRSYPETVKMSSDKMPKIILANAGFMQVGHVTTWARTLLPNKNNTIIFTGYAPMDSPAGKLKNKNESGQHSIKMDGSIVFINAEVISFNSFSSHIQYQDLLNYIIQTNSQEIVLVHGTDKEDFRDDLEKILGDKGLSTKVTLPKKNQIIYF